MEEIPAPKVARCNNKYRNIGDAPWSEIDLLPWHSLAKLP